MHYRDNLYYILELMAALIIVGIFVYFTIPIFHSLEKISERMEELPVTVIAPPVTITVNTTRPTITITPTKTIYITPTEEKK